MAREFEDRYRVRDNDVVDAAFFNDRFRPIDDRVYRLEERDNVATERLDAVVSDAQQRVEQALTPVVEQLFGLQEKGFLVLPVRETPPAAVNFVAGLQDIPTVTDSRASFFNPGAWVALRRTSTIDDWAIAKVASFDAAFGILSVDITHTGGDPGPHADVEITATGGATIAELMTLEAATTAAATIAVNVDDAVTARSLAEAARNAAMAAADDAADSAAAAATYDPAQFYTKGQVDTALGAKANSAALAAVATSGAYNDLTGKPAPAMADIQEFAASGTWTKPASKTMAMIEIWGGGGGGGSGRRGAAGSYRSGGGGGGGGAYVRRFVKLSTLGATETVTIGAGGPGGASQTANDTDGVYGGEGSATTFGAVAKAWGGVGGVGGKSAVTTDGGRGGGTLSGNLEPYWNIDGGAAGTSDPDRGPTGGSAINGGGGGGAGTSHTGGSGGGSAYGGPGGGGGGGINTSNLSDFGREGGSQSTESGGGGSGGTMAAGSAGAAFRGGGGGAGRLAGTGYDGGAGGTASGGGGGGGSTNGNPSGAGAPGGSGFARITCW